MQSLPESLPPRVCLVVLVAVWLLAGTAGGDAYRVLVFRDAGRASAGEPSSIADWSRAMVDAARVSAHHANAAGGIGGHEVEIVVRPVGGGRGYRQTLEDYLAEVAAPASGPNVTNAGRLIAVFGIARTSSVEELLPTLKKHSLLSFGHNMVTNNLPINQYNVFTDVSPRVQLLALVREFIVRQHLRRIGVIYVQLTGYHLDEELDIGSIREMVGGFGLPLAGVFVARQEEGKPLDEAAYLREWADFAAQGAQAVIVMGNSIALVGRVVQDALLRLTAGRTVVLGVVHNLATEVSVAIESMFDVRAKAEHVAAHARIRQNATLLYTLGTPTTSMEYTAMAAFRQQYKEAYVALPGPQRPEMSYQELNKRSHTRDVFSSHLAGGWLAFQVLLEAMRAAAARRPAGAMFSRADLRESTFAQRVFVPQADGQLELSYGIYSAGCQHLADDQGDGGGGEACTCNQGGHSSFIAALDWKDRLLRRVGTFRSEISDCQPLKQRMKPTVILYRPGLAAKSLGLYETFSQPMQEFDAIRKGHKLVVPFIRFTGVNSYDNVRDDLNSSSQREVLAIQQNAFASVIGGGLLRLPLSPVLQMAIIDPVPHVTLPFSWFKFSRNLIRVSSIPELELKALAGFIEWQTTGRNRANMEREQATYKDINPTAVYLCINDKLDRGVPYYGPEKRDLLVRYVRTMLASHMLELREVIYMTPEDSDAEGALRRSYADNAYLIVIGFNSAELEILIKVKKSYPSIRVLLPFTELIRIYDVLLRHSKTLPTEMLEQIYFSTSLPAWLPPYGHPTSNESLEELPQLAEVRRAFRVGGNGTDAFALVGPTVNHFYRLTQGHPHLRTPYVLQSYILEQFLSSVAQQIIAADENLKNRLGKTTTQQITSDKILEYIYAQRYITVDETLSYGPFHDEPCGSEAREEIDVRQSRESMWTDPERAFSKLLREEACERNWARSRMYVRSLASAMGRGAHSPVQNPAEAARDYMFLPSQHGMYESLPAESRSILLPMALGLAGGLVLLAAALFALYWFCFRAKPRDVSQAPKDASRPVTLIFTDIQGSTSLWAEIPDTMGPALDAHHALIRKLIEQHRGYEVKTIGDAFMVAFVSATDAVAFAHRLQFVFFEFDWEAVAGTDIEDTYRQLEQMRVEDVLAEDSPDGPLAVLPFGGATHMVTMAGEAFPPAALLHEGTSAPETCSQTRTNGDSMHSSATGTHAEEAASAMALLDVRTRYLTCHLPPELYEATWHGLRVRIGVNTGFADIKLDAITQGYDYYGNVTNVASRTEACAWGGQVVITDPTLRALRLEAEEAGAAVMFETASYGLQPLRGVPEPLELHHVYTVPGRMFGPLRLDSVYAKQGEEASSDSSPGTGSSRRTGEASAGAQLRDEDLLAGLALTLFRTLFSTTARRKRTGDLEALCRSWRVRPSRRRSLKMLRDNTYLQWRVLTRRGLPGAVGTIHPGLMAAAEGGCAGAKVVEPNHHHQTCTSTAENNSGRDSLAANDSTLSPPVLLSNKQFSASHSYTSSQAFPRAASNGRITKNASEKANNDDYSLSVESIDVPTDNVIYLGPLRDTDSLSTKETAPLPLQSLKESPASMLPNNFLPNDAVPAHDSALTIQTLTGYRPGPPNAGLQTIVDGNVGVAGASKRASLSPGDLEADDELLIALAAKAGAVAFRQLPRTVRHAVRLARLALVGAELADKGCARNRHVSCATNNSLLPQPDVRASSGHLFLPVTNIPSASSLSNTSQHAVL